MLPMTDQPQAPSNRPFSVSPMNSVVRSARERRVLHAAGDPFSADL